MSVLDSIIEGVREDLAARRLPLSKLHELMEAAPLPILPKFPSDQISVIAEVKRKSPSKGDLAQIPEPAKLASQYQQARQRQVTRHTDQIQKAREDTRFQDRYATRCQSSLFQDLVTTRQAESKSKSRRLAKINGRQRSTS